MTADAAFNVVRQIKSHAFSNNSTVNSIILPNKTEVIETKAFENCQELESVFIPQKVTNIEPQAFTQCPYLDQLVVSDNSTNYKFINGMMINLNDNIVVACAAGMSGNIVIPDSIVGISKYVFAEKQIASVKIPKSLTKIEEGAFMGCQLLSTLTLPAELNFIGTKAFKGCTGLRQIAVRATMPPQVEEGTFDGVDYASVYLCVPSESLDIYLNAYGWNLFNTVIGISQPEAKKLVVYMKDGGMDSYILSEKPVITTTGQELVISTYSSSKTYRIDKIRRMQYFYEKADPTLPEDEPYAIFKDGTLTFYYDQQKQSRSGETFELNTDDNYPDWYRLPDITKVVFDASFANARPTTTYKWFCGMSNITSMEGIQYLNTSSVTNMAYMFRECSALTSLDVSHFNTSNCTNMEHLFSMCSGLTSLDVSSFNTANCTNMNDMFYYCGKLENLDVSHFDTSKCTIIEELFKYDRGLKTLSISSTMENLGENACEDVGSWYNPCTLIAPEGFNFGVDTSGNSFVWKSGTFKLGNTIFTVSTEEVKLKIGETEKVQLIAGNGDYTISNSNPDVVKVELDGEETVITAIGRGTATIIVTDNLTNQQVTIEVKVTAPTTMKVEPMKIHFYMPKGSSKTEYFTVYNTGDGTLTFHLDYSTMDGIFNVLEGGEEYILEAGESKKFALVCSIPVDYEYSGGGMALRIYSDATNWDYHNDWINVGFTPTEPDPETEMAYAVFKDGTLTFYYDLKRNSREGSVYDLNIEDNEPGWYVNHYDVRKVVFDASFVGVRPTTTYRWFDEMYNLATIEGIEYLNTSNVSNMGHMFNSCGYLKNLDVSHFDTSQVTNMESLFSGCRGVACLDVKHFNTSNVTSMNGMFNGCGSLVSIDLSHFDTSNVADLGAMFMNCQELTSLNVSNFNTSNVTTMEYMFCDCKGLTDLDVSSFNTSNVKTMSLMFGNCERLSDLDVSHFDTSNVTDMSFMFYECYSLTSLDVSHFNTSNVTNMNYMFSSCSNLTALDVSHFDTSNVTGMHRMFSECYNLAALDVSHFNTSNVTSMDAMFYYCEQLDELDVSNFNTSNVTNMYQMFSHLKIENLNVSNFDMSKCEDTAYMFQYNSRLKSLTVSSTMENLDETACDDIGWWVPCIINAPESFNFGIDTSGESFTWKSGTFKLGATGIAELLDFSQLPPFSHVKIFDTAGKMIMNFSIGEIPQPLDLNGLGIGVFIVKINGVTYKIVRK